jgi:peroxiredoxin Q/BCP
MSKIIAGDRAPTFSLQDQNGLEHSLGAQKGKWVLLYFYPRDNTPGCTVEAQTIRNDFEKFKKLTCTVFGISTDSVESHKKFAEKQSLPFALLADTEKKVVEKYGVWQQKKMAGREYMGIVRMSFLVDPEGKIAKIYTKVKPALHAAEVLEDLREFQ